MLLKTSYKMKPPVSARLIPGHPLADKLIACYLLNEGSGVTAHDSSGRGHHGTLTGGATWVVGKFGPAVDLDGTDGHIVVPDHDDFTPALSPLSVSADIYMHDATNFMIACKGAYNVDGEWQIYLDSVDRLLAQAYDESVDDCRIGRLAGAALTSDENSWLHVVLTYTGGVTNSAWGLYVGGVRVDDTDWGGNEASFVAVENLAHDVWLGRYLNIYADGVLGNVMVWRRVLTQSDIVRLGADRFCMFEQRRRTLAGVPS